MSHSPPFLEHSHIVTANSGASSVPEIRPHPRSWRATAKMVVMIPCKLCAREASQSEFLFGHFRSTAVDSLCIAPLILQSGSDSCGNDCMFLPFSSHGSHKRDRLDFRKSSVAEESITT